MPVVVVPAAEIDAYGLHVANIAGMRRALGQLASRTGVRAHRRVPGARPGGADTAVWKGDATVACIAAASILAKVTRDRIMTRAARTWPHYEFAQHKGYVTPAHSDGARRVRAVRRAPARYVNVARRVIGCARMPGQALSAESA